MKNLKTRPDHLSSLETLTYITYGSMWKRSASDSYYNWKFFKNFKSHINSTCAFKNNQLVGHLASWHKRFTIGNQLTNASELTDAMVNPDFRRAGVWEGISKKVIQEAEDKKYFPIYGTLHPLRASYKGFKNKLGFESIFPIFRLMMPLPAIRGIAGAKGLSSLSLKAVYGLYDGFSKSVLHLFHPNQSQRVIIREVKDFGQWMNQLWKEEKKNHFAGVVKDYPYMRYRFDENPDPYTIFTAEKKGEVVGVLVTATRKENNNRTFGFIVDHVIPSRDNMIFFQLIQRAVQQFIKQNVCVIDTWSTLYPFSFQTLLRLGFLPVSYRPFIMPVSHVQRLRDKGWKNGRKWIINLADSDNI